MKLIIRTLLFITAAISLSAFAQNAAVVNGKPIPQSMVDAIIKNITAQGQPDTEKLRAIAKESLIMHEVLFQEAEKRNLASNDDVKQQLEMAYRDILVNSLTRDFIRQNPVTDEEAKTEYDRIKTEIGDTEYNAWHILVKTEEEANAILKQIKDGSKFEEVALTKSIDSESSEKGGDLEWATPNQFVEPFAQALKQLKKDEMTQSPIKTEYGYHIILLKDTRTFEFPDLETLKPKISQQIQEKKWLAYKDKLRAEAKVE